MPSIGQTNGRFRARLDNRDPLLGAFIKTPHPIVIEIMAQSGFDFLVLDAEHGPFDRANIDTMMIAGRACECPLIVRIPDASAEWTLTVLDAGAAGLMVPHVLNAAQASELAAAMDYTPGGRGFAGTTRAADYARRDLKTHLAQARRETMLICQIEDPEGARNAGDIAAVEGVDALFIGRADLAVSHGRDDFHDPDIGRMSDEILGCAGAATGLYCAPSEDLEPHRRAGATLFVVGSDHTLMSGGGTALRKRFDAM